MSLFVLIAIMSTLGKGIEELSSDELCGLLGGRLPGLSGEVFDNIIKHKIDGELFQFLDDEYLREIAPLLGDRLKIRRMINQMFTLNPNGNPDQQPSTVSYTYNIY